MQLNVFHNMDLQVFEKCCDIVEWMLKNNCQQLLLKGLHNCNFNHSNEERIVLNTTKSPNGAKGAFLLLKKSRFNDLHPVAQVDNEVKTLIDNLKEKDKPFRQNGSIIQYYFEDLFEQKLKEVVGEKNFKRTCKDHMNEYDFIVFLSKSNILIDVKSDKWFKTENVSLEIVRDCDKNNLKNLRCPTNMGSIIKTRADYWVVFYYDNENSTYHTDIYWIPGVKKVAYDIIIYNLKI